MRRIFLLLLMTLSVGLVVGWFALRPTPTPALLQVKPIVVPQVTLSLAAIKGELTDAQCYALAKLAPTQPTLLQQVGWAQGEGPGSDEFSSSHFDYPIRGTSSEPRYCVVDYPVPDHNGDIPPGRAAVTLDLAGPGVSGNS